jgi:hypothetical protein
VPGDPTKTAIVETSAGIYGFAAIEMPEARFREQMTLPLHPFRQLIPICPDYLAAIEPDTLRIVSMIGGTAHLQVSKSRLSASLLVSPSPSLQVSKSLTLTLSAIRRGFRQPRFPEYTAEQMERNRQFYESAHN